MKNKLIPINTTADGCAFTVRARYDGACLKSLTGGGGYFPNTGVLEIIEMEQNRVIQVGSLQDRGGCKFSNKQQYRVYSTGGVSPCLNTCGGGGLEPKIISIAHGFKQVSISADVVPTITANSYECNNFLVNMSKTYKIRKLTPRECFRLMDVSETDIDKIQDAGISDSQQYKMAGNSIVVSCLKHIFRELFITKTQPIQGKLF